MNNGLKLALAWLLGLAGIASLVYSVVCTLDDRPGELYVGLAVALIVLSQLFEHSRNRQRRARRTSARRR